MQEQPDEELLREVRTCPDGAARRALLDQLFARYHSRIALWCFRVSGDREAARDMAQEVLLKAYQNLDSFRGDSKFSTWLYTIARNHCFNQSKRLSNVKEKPVDPVDLDEAIEDRFDLRLEREEELRNMRALLANALDETEQRVMTLHYGEELPLEAVTRVLGLANQSGAKAYIVSARRKLQTAVSRFRARETGRRIS